MREGGRERERGRRCRYKTSFPTLQNRKRRPRFGTHVTFWLVTFIRVQKLLGVQFPLDTGIDELMRWRMKRITRRRMISAELSKTVANEK